MVVRSVGWLVVTGVVYFLTKIYFFLLLQVTWIRHRDLHLLTVDKATYTSDQRFVSVNNPQIGDWSLQVFASIQFLMFLRSVPSSYMHLPLFYFSSSFIFFVSLFISRQTKVNNISFFCLFILVCLCVQDFSPFIRFSFCCFCFCGEKLTTFSLPPFEIILCFIRQFSLRASALDKCVNIVVFVCNFHKFSFSFSENVCPSFEFVFGFAARSALPLLWTRCWSECCWRELLSPAERKIQLTIDIYNMIWT